MKRRDVMKLGAVAAGAGIGVPGCAVPRMLDSMRGPDGAAAFNAMLDDQLGMLSQPGLLQRLAGQQTKKPLAGDVQEKLNAHDAMFRRMLSTIVVTQGFRELPFETQMHAAVQDRMWKHADLISNMVFEVGEMLAKLDPLQRGQLRTKLQEVPDLPMQLGEALDDRAAKAGMSHARRMQLRSMMKQTSFKLRAQDPSVLIDNVVAQVQRMRPTGEADARALAAAEKLMERDFWRRQRLATDDPTGAMPAPPATGAGSGAPSPSPAPAPQTPAPQAPAPQAAPPNPTVAQLTANARAAAKVGDCRLVVQLGRYVRDLDPKYYAEHFRRDDELRACMQKIAVEDHKRVRPRPAVPPDPPPSDAADPQRSYPGSGAVTAGGYMLGIGVLVTVISAIGVQANFAFVFGLTLGVVLLGVGLLVLLIGALIYAAS